MAKTRLPIFVERSLAEASIARTRIAQTYEDSLRDKVQDNGTPITCTKGCSNCCYYPVLVSLFEGVNLYRWLVDSHAWTATLRQKLEEAASSVKGLSLDVWLLSAIPCPFLAPDNTCSVYAARPFSCRVTYSIGDPHYCHPHRLGDLTGILPKNALSELVAAEESAILASHHVAYFRLPLAAAILAGERICKEGLEIGDWLEAVT